MAGILLGVAAAAGLLLSVIYDMEFLKGVYVALFGVGVLMLLYASLMLIGSPKRRFEYYTRMEFRSDSAKPSEGKHFEAFGILPALLGITAIVLGFVLEAWYRTL